MAWGQIGLKPREYYLLDPYEFYCIVEGFMTKRKNEIEVARFAAYRIHQSLVEKPVQIDKFWPMADKVEEIEDIEMTPEMLDDIKKTFNVR